MKLSSHKLDRRRRIDLQMTSMIDVVFLLLIFFMVTTSFVKTERHLDSNTKVNQSSAAAASHLEPAIVDVTHIGGGEYVMRLGERDFTEGNELASVLKQFDNKVDGAFVRVEDGAPFDLVAAAIQACKSAGFLSVSYVPQSK